MLLLGVGRAFTVLFVITINVIVLLECPTTVPSVPAAGALAAAYALALPLVLHFPVVSIESDL